MHTLTMMIRSDDDGRVAISLQVCVMRENRRVVGRGIADMCRGNDGCLAMTELGIAAGKGCFPGCCR